MNSKMISACCQIIQQDYTACDVSDALLTLKVQGAGFLPDLAPLRRSDGIPMRIVAPVSTAVLVPKSNLFLANGVHAPNIPLGKNWTDCPEPGTIVLVQQPATHVSAIFGDIMVTRLKSRGVLGAVADGRIRDVASCMDLCRNGDFQVWHRGISAAGPSLEAKPWAVDIPLQVGKVLVNPGDILCGDEGSQAIVVIPLQKLEAVMDLLPVHKKASDQVMEDVSRGYSLTVTQLV